MKGKLSIFVVVSLAFALAVAGCGMKEETGRQSAVTERVTADWEQGFQKSALSEGEKMYALDYKELSHEHPEDNGSPRLHIIKAVDNNYLDFCRYYFDDRTVYYLEKISMDGETASHIHVHPKDWGIEDNEIWGFDAVGEQYYFAVGVYADEVPEWVVMPEQCYVVATDSEGKFRSQVDILPALLELGFDGQLRALYVDGKGYMYITTMDERKECLYVVDAEGRAVSAYKCSVPSNDIIYNPVHDDSGRIFFPIRDSTEKATRLLWKNGNNEIAELSRLENATIETWYTMRGNELYYSEGGTVVKWDVVTGQREKIFSLKENGISESFSTTLFWDDSENAYLRYTSKSEDWVIRLSYDEPLLGDPVSVGIMTWGAGGDFVQSSLATFCRKNPQQPVVVEKTLSTDNSKDRMLIDVMNGKGPDVLYLSYEDLLKLKNHSAIAEMGDLIPDSIRDTLIPGVTEFGEIDGKMYGIPTSVEIQTMFTNRELWDGEGWTLDDVLDMAEDDSDLYGIFTWGSSNADAYETLRLLTEFDITQKKSKFIDWENGISCFEEKDFMRVLETVQYYEKHRGDKGAYERYGIESKAVLALDWGMLSPEAFFYLMDIFGENCYAVGVPAEDCRGNYLMAEGLLAVNASVPEDKLEIIREMICYLLSKKCQLKLHQNISVIEGMVDINVWYSEPDDQYYWWDGTDDWRYLKQKEDGTTYTEEYKELLHKAIPYREYCPIYDIVQEEAGAFFAGQKDALAVTRLIDSRVQLYLDENK